MEADEKSTYLALQKHLNEVIKPEIEKQSGRLVKLMGDGVLAEFASVVDAVGCALAIQEKSKTIEATAERAHRISWRIGVHLGDVISDHGDIHGDGVNIASRLESLAKPGSVCISRQVLEHAASHFDIAWHDLGDCKVKNIERPIQVFSTAQQKRGVAPPSDGMPDRFRWAAALLLVIALAVGGYWNFAPSRQSEVSDTAGMRQENQLLSLAVMPFESLSEDEDHEYLADGMTDDLITDLANVSGLLVIARNTTFMYKNTKYDLAELAEEIGARYVVSGSLRRAGEQIRINVQLVDMETGANIWAERYDGDNSDVLALQDVVRTRIVEALKIRLTPEEEERLSRPITENAEAYDAYLRARQQESFFTQDSTLAAIRLYHQALEIDPGFVTAKARLAAAYTLAVDSNWVADTTQTLELARSLAREAIAQDDRLPLAYWALARVYTRREFFDGEKAIANLRRTLEINPNYADGHASLAIALHLTGKAEKGLSHIETAMRLNPQAPFWYYFALGANQFHLTRFEAAKESFLKSAEQNPRWRSSRYYLVSTLGHLNETEDAEWEMEELRLLGFEPTMERFRETMKLQDPVYSERFFDGLRMAGVPEN